MTRVPPQPNRIRRGVTTVEFAMTAPLLFLMLHASLELGHVNMVYNTVEAACYEGARVGIVPGATASECTAAAQRVLDISSIRGATIAVTPNNLSTLSDTVQVRITVLYSGTSVVVPMFTRSLTINHQCVLTRERN